MRNGKKSLLKKMLSKLINRIEINGNQFWVRGKNFLNFIKMVCLLLYMISFLRESVKIKEKGQYFKNFLGNGIFY